MRFFWVGIFIIIILGQCLDGHIGQRFIFSLPETFDQKVIKSWLDATHPGGVMLTAFHVQHKDQAKELISFIQEITNTLIAIDWEGGIVSRPKESGGFFSVPSPWALAKAGRSACFLAGMLIGHQLRDIGVDMDFAPSLDLFGRQILATRCFSSDPDIVSECGIAFAKGLETEGVTPVIKHFPGLASGTKDTHLDGTIIDISAEELEKNIRPFKKSLQADINTIMVSHAIVPDFDTVPATLSKNIVTYIKSLNPNAILITDDFSMKAVTQKRSLHEAVTMAFGAGYDFIIYSGTIQDQINLIKSVKNVPVRKAKHIQKKLQHPTLDEEAVAKQLALFCVQSPEKMPDISHKHIIFTTVDLPKIRPSESWFVHDKKSYLKNTLQAYFKNTIQEYLLNPLDKKSINTVKSLVAQARKKNAIVIAALFFYGQGSWNIEQDLWLSELKKMGDNLIILTLGMPIKTNHAVINLGSFQKPILDRAIEIITTSCTPLLSLDTPGARPEYAASRRVSKGRPTLGMSEILKMLAGKHFGVLCHACSVMYEPNKKPIFLPDKLYAWAKKQKNATKLTAIFSPEHGLQGHVANGENVASQNTSRWECPVYSLYGKTKKPTPEMLKDLDVIVIDLQDVGVRCFTYPSTIELVLQEAKKYNISVIVLDRQNPLACWGTKGPMLNPAFSSFIGRLPTPFLHGLSMGQIAKLLNKTIGAELTVLSASYFDRLSMGAHGPYIQPSPNLNYPITLFCYPITVFLEGTNYSEGRGTQFPFQQIGAPWINAKALAQTLNRAHLPGIWFEPISFTPRDIPGMATNSKHKHNLCHGVFLHIHDIQKVAPMLTAKTILETLFLLNPKKSTWIKTGKQYTIDLLVGNNTWRTEITEDTNSY
jgi:uncharacterized protein YbbC (DUF1343 family)/beta-glucosidase-like glycosyl hydrolase